MDGHRTFLDRTLSTAGSAVRLYLQPFARLGSSEPVLPSGGYARKGREVKSLDRELRHRWLRATITSSTPAFRRELESTVEWAKSAENEIHYLASATEQQYRMLMEQWDPTADSGPLRPIYYQSKAASMFKLTAWLMTLLSAALGTAFAMVSFSVDLLGAVALGATAAVLTVVSATALGTAIVTANLETPRRARDRLVRLSMFFGAFQLVALGVLLMARSFAAAVPFVPVTLDVLAIVTPIMAGLLGATGRLLSWSGDLAAEFQSERRLGAAISQIREYSSAILAKHPS